MFLKKLLKKPNKKDLRPFKSLVSSLALFFLSFYQAFLSAFMGGACRFYPSCSVYAQQVYQSQPFIKATFLVLRRLLSCQPLGPKYREEPEIQAFLEKNPHVSI